VESRIGADEAKQLGLVSRVVAAEQLLPEAKSIAAKIASLSAPAVAKAKDCINRSYEMNLSEGLRYELCVPLALP
jgi:enoyl-CoA hydratase